MKLLRLFLAFFLFAGVSFAATPAVFFTDLTSGPNTGGENNNGTILTIYGKNFGATQSTSTVTIGGHAVAAYLTWDVLSKSPNRPLETISVAIGSAATTGVVAVNVAGVPSICENIDTNCNFTVRVGTIYCVSLAGNDGNPGTFPSSCWRTIPKAAHSEVPGGIAYVMNGVTATGQDNFNANVLVTVQCSTTNPCALVGYPGATVTVGGVSDQNRAFYLGFDPSDFWTIANMTIRAVFEGTENNGNSNGRFINNDISCPNGDGEDACNHAENGSSFLYFYGNYIHNIATNCSTGCKFYHAWYMSTNVNHVWAGWNEVAPNPARTSKAGCRAMQFNSTGGSDQFDLHIHDNNIHDAICDGINFNTVNANNGTVEAYNNVVWNVGTGPDPNGAAANYTCVNLGSSVSPTTHALIYNNTFYNCGSRGVSEGDAGGFSLFNPTTVINNILSQLAAEGYFSNTVVNSIACSNFVGSSHTIMFGLGANTYCASTFTATNSNPVFVAASTTAPDFHLQASSPAIGAGSATKTSTWDFDGQIRPSPPSLGAYEISSTFPPTPPTGVALAVF